MGFLLTTLDFKGEEGAAAVGKILLIQSVVGMLGQGGMVHMLHLGMVCEELHDLLGVCLLYTSRIHRTAGADISFANMF